MPQPYVPLLNVYRVRIQKAGAEDQSDTWFNEYDITYPNGVQPAIGDAVLGSFLQYEQTLHYNDVQFLGIDVNDYHVGRPPAGTGFSLFIPLVGAVGNQPNAGNSLAGQGGGPIGGEVCLVVLREVANKRRGGRNFYRGCLQAHDVAATAGGEWAIVNNSQFPAQFAAHSLPLIAPYYGPGGATDPHVYTLVSAQRSAVPPHYITGFGTALITSVNLTMIPTTNKISRKSKR